MCIKLESKLSYYKMLINSNYGVNNIGGYQNLDSILQEVYKLKIRIISIEKRKKKIRNLLDI